MMIFITIPLVGKKAEDYLYRSAKAYAYAGNRGENGH
jgi:hypothetical protein